MPLKCCDDGHRGAFSLTYHRGVPYIKDMEASRDKQLSPMGADHKAQLDRMSRIEGQVRGIRRMIEEERCCHDILLQLKSVINALSRVQDNVFRGHLESCVRDSLAGSDQTDRDGKIAEIIDLVSRFSRQ